uniref:Microtubule-associated protein RP/EB family member 1 n=1 Tax=Euplotes harpa TaxID=151035 RepID=A0A7S3J2L2_9SPIT|mmetsp:Transcript_13589/g.15761  ORF Transcript_13589/g.15761 Transcript_13589/m.15761 type:complete len:318 (+) Transcript_13589:19-972(+)
MSGDSIGMMEGAFFVGRGELLQWVNELLDLNISKVEQCATGAVYAQIIDAIYPGTFPLAKVNWQAKHEYEFVNNFKILQKAFDKNGITRHIEVQKLVKAKYQDNLEFLQWLKRYFDINYNGEPYDAVGRRKGVDLLLIGSGNKPVTSGASKIGGEKKKFTKPASVPSAGVGSSAPKKFTKPTPSSTAAPGHGATGGAGSAVQAKKIQELEGEIAELKLTSDTLEKERDFYFGKLRDIEVLLQAYQEQEIPVVELVLKILYATEDERVEVDENGNLNIVNTAEDGAAVEQDVAPDAEPEEVEGELAEGEGELLQQEDM